MNWQNHIVVDPEVLAGKPTLKGTRIAVDFLLGLFAQGWSLEQVLENYPGVTEPAVRAAFAFASETLGDEAVYPSKRQSG